MNQFEVIEQLKSGNLSLNLLTQSENVPKVLISPDRLQNIVVVKAFKITFDLFIGPLMAISCSSFYIPA